MTVRNVRNMMEFGVLGSRQRYFQGPLRFFYVNKEWNATRRKLRAFANAVADQGYKELEVFRRKHGESPWHLRSEPEGKVLMFRFLEMAHTRTELVDSLLQYFMGATSTLR